MNEEMDRRMKDLMTRVVEMAPEAPPFPEETLTLSPAPAKRGLRPVMVFAAAAAVVLLVALPLLLLQGDGGVEPAVTTLPAPTTTPSVPDTSAPDTTVPVEVSLPVTAYFTQTPANPNTGNPALVPVTTLWSAPEGSPEALVALQALLDPNTVPPPGLEDHIPPEVAVLGLVEEGDMIMVDMNQAFLAGSGTGLLGDITMLNQLIYTVTQNDPVGVVFTVEGQAPGPYGTEGILLDTAFTRDYYRDELNSVNVTTAVGPESTELSGVANVFEATVLLEIVDAAGEVVDFQVTTATCGSGCWGEFTFALDPALLEPGGQVRVFWNSPEDGEPSDVVTIPIPESEDGLWDLTP
jgi:spore germination protein GerM